MGTTQSAVKVAVRVEGLSVGYNNIPVQKNLSFEVAAGSIFAILGGSGCGKTTLLQNLVGLHRPLAGSVDVMEEGWPNLEEGLPPFGVAFQGGALFGSMSLAENVAMPLRRWTNLSAEAVLSLASARLALVGLAGFGNHLPSEVSGGMQKRAGIARALAMEPRLLFLDEPSAGLDPITAVELDDLLTSLRDNMGVTTVLVTHELPSIFRIADECIMLGQNAGGVIANGPPLVLRDESDDPRVQAFFHRRSLS
ncbi:MAG: phospholipid/cholesterol/gamma-HCH transport system ATP-binding protein [Candidatus Paceibacteria bacterium]|jgi:phospholipid/cholesterol/gamma-HCH transport system ATP-binding protein